MAAGLLGGAREGVYRVPSMGTPADGDDARAIWASEAVRLLDDRAGRVQAVSGLAVSGG